MVDQQKFVIVVLEDEPLIRLAACDALINEGLEVIETGHADEALHVLETRANNIHLLFSDVNVPGSIDGIALAHHSHAHWPWIGVIVTSGRVQPRQHELPETVRFIPKPYELEHVVRHVREMLAAP